MNAAQALIFAILQGATELFPVSSLGHAVIFPNLAGWDIDQRGSAFLPFVVMLHVGTAIALLAYFWRDWVNLFLGVIGQANPGQVQAARRVAGLIMVATIPAVIVGFALEHYVRALFASPIIAAIFLVVNGGILLFGERLRTRSTRTLANMGPKDALVIGLFQCLALIPGISRSGVTIVGGLLRGINHGDSAHFSFLIATPIIIGATVLEVPKLLHASIPAGTFPLATLAAIVSGITAFASTWFLMRYFRSHDSWALDPFGWYCIVAGLLSLAVFAL